MMFNDTQSSAQSSPLGGLTVLDLTHALAGPFASFLLAGLGARVIKIENPDAPDPCRQNPPYLGADGVSLTRRNDDDVSVSALNRLRGKYAVTLNLKHPQGRDVFADLVRSMPILSSRTSVRERSTGSVSATRSQKQLIRALSIVRYPDSGQRKPTDPAKPWTASSRRLAG